MKNTKNGSYINGLNAFLRVFKDRFNQYSIRESENSVEIVHHQRNNKVICEIHWRLDWGGLYLVVSSEFFNSNIPKWNNEGNIVFCNRPLNPSLASNYIAAARLRRKKPKYKQEACRIAKQILVNYQNLVMK